MDFTWVRINVDSSKDSLNFLCIIFVYISAESKGILKAESFAHTLFQRLTLDNWRQKLSLNKAHFVNVSVTYIICEAGLYLLMHLLLTIHLISSIKEAPAQKTHFIT